MRIHFLLGLLAIGLVLSQGTSADAQGRGRGDRGGGDRGSGERRGDDERRGDRGRDGDRGGRDGERGRDGDRGRGGPWGGGGGGGGGSWGGGGGGGPWGGGGGGNPEDFWKRFDRNGDGMLAPDEIDERFRERLGINKPTKISDLVSRLQREREQREGGGSGGNNGDKSKEKPLVPGFGVENEEKATVLGFGKVDTPESENKTSSSGSNEKSPSESASGGGPVSSNGYVDGVFKQRDANGNGTLEGDELAAPGLPRGADKNSDGKITKEELMEATGSRPSSSTKSTSNSSVRRSYRFASAHERLNGSAKSWIVSRDKNGDGQVSMHEFSSTWSESKVREFQRYDLNGDGIVTAAEYENR